MKQHVLRLTLAGLVVSTLAACGSSGNKANDPPPVVVVPPDQLDGFGARFGTAFRADPNSEPYLPAEGDIAPLDLTTEPKPIT